MNENVRESATTGVLDKYPSNVVLAGVVGSTAYHLDTAKSDVDTLGVYLAPTRDVLGVNGPRVVKDTVVFSSPHFDATFHEMGKFVSLCLKTNPTVLELLYLERYTVATEVGRAMVEVREAFLSAGAVRNAYGGYAMSQAARLSQRTSEGKKGFGTVPNSRVEKHARHCLRLLMQGIQLQTEGTLTINASPYREELFEGGKLAVNNPEEYQRAVEHKFATFEEASLHSVLPALPDAEKINDMLIDARLS